MDISRLTSIFTQHLTECFSTGPVYDTAGGYSPPHQSVCKLPYCNMEKNPLYIPTVIGNAYNGLDEKEAWLIYMRPFE